MGVHLIGYYFFMKICRGTAFELSLLFALSLSGRNVFIILASIVGMTINTHSHLESSFSMVMKLVWSLHLSMTSGKHSSRIRNKTQIYTINRTKIWRNWKDRKQFSSLSSFFSCRLCVQWVF